MMFKLVYLDPPYWKQAKNQYSDDPTDLGNMGLEDFTTTLAKIITQFGRKLPSGAVIAMLMQPTQWRAPDISIPITLPIFPHCQAAARYALLDSVSTPAVYGAACGVGQGEQEMSCPDAGVSRLACGLAGGAYVPMGARSVYGPTDG